MGIKFVHLFVACSRFGILPEHPSRIAFLFHHPEAVREMGAFQYFCTIQSIPPVKARHGSKWFPIGQSGMRWEKEDYSSTVGFCNLAASHSLL
jgi:hypothetical protein